MYDEWVFRVVEALEYQTAETLGAPAKVFDVPRALFDTKPDAYAPQHIALGPYHQSRPDLKDMLRYKLAAAKRVERLFAGDRKIPDLVSRFISLKAKMREPYHRLLELSHEKLAWMMAIDSCFLLDFLIGRYQQQQGEATDTAAVSSSATYWINATVGDLLMLENQLPLVLLARNLELRYASEQAAADVLRAALDRFIRDVCPIKTYANKPLPDVTNQAHLLELLYRFLVPTTAAANSGGGQLDDGPPPAAPENDNDDQAADDIGDDLEKQLPAEYENVKWASCLSALQVSSMIRRRGASVDVVKARLKDVDMGTTTDSPPAQAIKIPSVAQLASCGVRFVPAPEGIEGVSFDHKAETLSLPIIVLDGTTEVVLRNLVAYESVAVAVRGGPPPVLARYTELMSGLLGTAEDVGILQRSRVVVNRMKSRAEAASMWDGMCRAATRASGRVPQLDAVVRALNAHRDKNASARAQKLLHKYYMFMSWKILTLIASVLLLLMTALQTFCSTYPCQSTWFRNTLPSS